MDQHANENLEAFLCILQGINKIKTTVSTWFEDNPEIVKTAEKALGLFAATSGLITKDIYSWFETRMRVYPGLIDHLSEYAQQGWFISLYFGFSELDQLAQQCHGISIEQSEHLLLKMYSDSIFEHAGDIIRDNPDREFVIRPAIEAHKRKEYALSVPIFFAQAEGILSAKCGKYLFCGKKDEQVFSLANKKMGDTSKELVDPLGDLEALMARLRWMGLREKPPISYNQKEREKHNYFGLNRNMVLHGEVLEEYATEINSLKAFSLLSGISALTSATA